MERGKESSRCKALFLPSDLMSDISKAVGSMLPSVLYLEIKELGQQPASATMIVWSGSG